MRFAPFEDTEEVEKLQKTRDELIASLETFNIEDSEKRFILRKINNITEKLLELARYKKDIAQE